MSRVLVICVLGLFPLSAFGQYLPNNGQAYQFAAMYNPAFSGVENFTDLKLSYRYQWSGFGTNAPKFLNMSFNTRFKQPLDLKHNNMRMSRPSTIRSENLPKGKGIIHGFGVNAFQSKVGVLKSIGGSLNFAWNYPVSKKFRLSLGISSLVESRKLQLEDITFREPDPFYDHLLKGAASQVDLSLRGGALLYSNGFYFGFSYLSILNRSIQASEVAFEEPFYMASFQSGFSVTMSPAVTLKPSALFLLQVDNSLSIDYNLKTYLQNKGWLGITYRDSQTGIFLLGLNVTDFLTATYSYEVSFGGFQQFSESSHELVLGLRINNFKKRETYIW